MLEAIAQSARISSPAAASPVTVLYLIDELCGVGGAENALLRMVRHLPRPRYRPLVATFRYSDAFPARDALCAPLYVLPVEHVWGISGFRAARSLRDLIRKESVRITHSFFETADLWGGAVAKWSGCPLLVSSRRDLGILRTWKHRLAYRAMGGMFDQVHAVSESVRRKTIDCDRLPADRVVTVHTGVDVNASVPPLSREELRRRLNAPASASLVVTVANLRPVKGIEVLLRAAKAILERRPNTVFLIVGDEPDRAYGRQLRALAVELGVSGSVRFWGPERQVGTLLAAADVFALLSHTEGFSNSVIEAMSSGLPCVVTDVGGNAEAVLDGKCGYVVPPGAADAAAIRMLELLDAPERRCEMAQAARLRAECHFTTDAMIRRLTECYEGLLRQ